MTVFYKEVELNPDNCCSSVDTKSNACIQVSELIWEECKTKTSDDYHKKHYMHWPLDKSRFDYYKKTKYLNTEVSKYNTFEEYQKENNKVEIIEDDDCGMLYPYSLLDDNHQHIFAYQDIYTITIVSMGTQMKYPPSDWRIKSLSEGWGIVINKFTYDITLVRLEEDDGNYWGDEEVSLAMMSTDDWNIVTTIINDLKDSDNVDRNDLIGKIFEISKNFNKISH